LRAGHTKCLLLLIAVFLSSSGFAQQPKPSSISGFYLGGGTNWGGIEVSDDDCDYFYEY
jgi:hypothetical protein